MDYIKENLVRVHMLLLFREIYKRLYGKICWAGDVALYLNIPF